MLQSAPRNEAIHYLAPVAVLIVGITVRKQREEIMFEIGIAFELVIGFAFFDEIQGQKIAEIGVDVAGAVGDVNRNFQRF